MATGTGLAKNISEKRAMSRNYVRPQTINMRKEMVHNVLKLVADYYRVPMIVFENGSRYPENIKIKQIARFLCVQFLNKKGRYHKSLLDNNDNLRSVDFKTIGILTGAKSDSPHFVVYQALTSVSNYYDTDPEYRKEVDELEVLLFKSADFGGRFIVSNLRELGMEMTISKDKLANIYCRIDTEVSSVTLTSDEMEILYYMWQNNRHKIKKV